MTAARGFSRFCRFIRPAWTAVLCLLLTAASLPVWGEESAAPDAKSEAPADEKTAGDAATSPASPAEEAAPEKAPPAKAEPSEPEPEPRRPEKVKKPETGHKEKTGEAPLSDKELVGMEEEWPEWMWQEERPRPWYTSVAAGYTLFTPDDGNGFRHGAGIRFSGGYTFEEHWRMGLRVAMSLNNGDAGRSTDGIYSLVNIIGEGRYVFDTPLDILHPYLTTGLGWQRTQLDRETATIFVTHSMTVNAGAGFVFDLSYAWRLGGEFSADPVIFGRQEVNGAVTYRTLLNLEYVF